MSSHRAAGIDASEVNTTVPTQPKLQRRPSHFRSARLCTQYRTEKTRVEVLQRLRIEEQFNIDGAGTSDCPIRIVVTPSQSSYFAGEPFSVKVSFTNTRSPEAGPSRPHSQHKRGAHSISSAPLARPPTSPGTPRTLATSSLLAGQKSTSDATPRRKGLVGMAKQVAPPSHDHIPELLEQRRRRQLAPTKSLSVTISQQEIQDTLGVVLSAPSSQTSYALPSPTKPHTPSPLARSHGLQLSSDHPHARKDSLLDGQFSLDFLGPTPSNSQPPFIPYTPNSSTPSFSLALDPISEGVRSPYPSTPTLGSPTIESGTLPPPHPHTPLHHPSTPLTTNDTVYSYPTRPHGYRPAPIGLGHPSTPSSTRTLPRPASELILYAYAQLSGTLVLTPTASSTPSSSLSYEATQTLDNLRSSLLNRAVLGGGSMDISSTLNSPNGFHMTPRTPSIVSRHRQTHSRSTSLGAGLLNMLSPSALVSTFSSSPNPSTTSTISHPLAPGSSGLGSAPFSAGLRSSSTSTGAFSPVSSTSPSTPTSGMFGLGLSSSVLGGSNREPDIDINPESPLPTLEVQPSMLAVDLELGPGETREFTYTINLPENLPPTFKGKSLRFSYELIVGTCRAGSSNSGSVSASSTSKVMKVPIRVYNNVSVSRSIKPYDLLWPVSRRRDTGMPGTEAKVQEGPLTGLQKGLLNVPSLTSPSPLGQPSSNFNSVREYAKSLLDSLSEPLISESISTLSPTDDIHSFQDNHVLKQNGSAFTNGNHDLKGLSGSGLPTSLASRNPRRMTSARSEELRRIEMEREKEAEGGLTGCREAVEILTRNPKKASYDVNKDGVQVAVLTFTKGAYRLGETITGIVELNERTGRSRVLKVSAILETQESLPSSIAPTSASSSRLLQRSHAESHSSFTLNTVRTTFSLDIPSDASPAFQVRVGTPPLSAPPTSMVESPKPGGLQWKVRLCLLVAIADELSMGGSQGVRFRSIERDGSRGEWGSSWMATKGNAPLERINPTLEKEREAMLRRQKIASPKSWSQFFVSSLFGDGGDDSREKAFHDGDDLDSLDDVDDERSSLALSEPKSMTLDQFLSGGAETVEYDGIIPDPAGGVGTGVDFVGGEDGWREVKLETVECEVPVRVFPGNTAFKAMNVVFDV